MKKACSCVGRVFTNCGCPIHDPNHTDWDDGTVNHAASREWNAGVTYFEMEYRVISMYRNNSQRGKIEHTIRQDGKFDNRGEALAFAASFTPPKFVGAYVEQRRVTRWERV